MSIFKDFANTIKNTAVGTFNKENPITNFTQTLKNTSISSVTNIFSSLTQNPSIEAAGDILGVSGSNQDNSLVSLFNNFLGSNGNISGSAYLGTSTNMSKYTSFETPWKRNKNKALFDGKATKYVTLSEQTPRAIMDFSEKWRLRLPDWGYDDFINERSMFQKQITTLLNDPAYFYFKVFFRFDTENGLFGGLLNNENNTAKSTKNNGFALANNSAAKYLYTCSGAYHNERIGDRILALKKFASLLSYITTNAPWFFAGVKGLNKVNSKIGNNFSEEKAIELDVTADAIDMRLTSLMSLYKYACFDNINQKEVIPENIRKFDMSIILFQTPIRYFHTSTYSEAHGKQKYKSLAQRIGSKGIGDDTMSFKMYSFTGCEFDMESFSEIVPNTVKNDKPFTTSETSIKITYTNCFEYTSNEFFGFLFGTDGFYYNQYSTFQNSISLNSDSNPYTGYINKIDDFMTNQEKRYAAMQDSLSDYSTGKTPNYNRLIDASEYLIHGFYDMGEDIWYKNGGLSGDNYAELGNLYGDVGIGSEYWREKLYRLRKTNRHDYIITAPPPKIIGNRNRYTSDTVKSKYWEDKLRWQTRPRRHNYDLSSFRKK